MRPWTNCLGGSAGARQVTMADHHSRKYLGVTTGFAPFKHLRVTLSLLPCKLSLGTTQKQHLNSNNKQITKIKKIKLAHQQLLFSGEQTGRCDSTLAMFSVFRSQSVPAWVGAWRRGRRRQRDSGGRVQWVVHGQHQPRATDGHLMLCQAQIVVVV